jgi:hypothetical protein
MRVCGKLSFNAISARGTVAHAAVRRFRKEVKNAAVSAMRPPNPNSQVAIKTIGTHELRYAKNSPSPETSLKCVVR